MEQEAADPDRDEVQDKENLPERALMERTFCNHHSPGQRRENEAAIRERIQRLGPKGRAEASLAILENSGSLEKRHRIRSSAMLALRLP
jgi:hypothetical protein